MRRVPASGAASGFSIVELLVVIAVSGVLLIFVFASFSGYRNRSELKDTAAEMVTLLREAQSRAMSQSSSTTWGVHFENSTTTPFYALFTGTYSTSGIVGYYRLPTSVAYATSSVAQGGKIEISFSQITGAPSTSTSFTIQTAAGALATSTITVSTSGAISF